MMIQQTIDWKIFNYLQQKKNLLKRDEAGYRLNPISLDRIPLIGEYLDSKLSYSAIAEMFDITRGHVRYIVRTHFPHIDQYHIIELNIQEIKELLDKEVSQYIIADRYGVDQATISRYINECIPEYAQDKITQRKLAVIKEGLINNETKRAIAKKLNCTDGNVIYYIKTYFPEYVKSTNAVLNEQQDTFVRKIKSLLDKGIEQQEIASILDTTRNIITYWIDKHLPEYQTATAYELRVKKVGELLLQNKTRKEICADMDITHHVLSSIIIKHYPEKSQDEKYADKLVEFKRLVSSNNNYTLPELAEKSDVGYVTAGQWLKAHFPDKHAAYLVPENRQKAIAFHKDNSDLNLLNIAIQTELPYSVVSSALQNRR